MGGMECRSWTVPKRAKPTLWSSALPNGSWHSGRSGAGSHPSGLSVPAGSALNTQLEVTHRPVTKEGLGGIAPSSLGPGRQVADRSYYLGVLRSKNMELQAEVCAIAAVAQLTKV